MIQWYNVVWSDNSTTWEPIENIYLISLLLEFEIDIQDYKSLHILNNRQNCG